MGEARKHAVAVNLGSEPIIREVFEKARNELHAQATVQIIDGRGKLVGEWNDKLGWKLHPKKPKRMTGPAIFVTPFTIRVKAAKTFEFPREGNEMFVAEFQPRKKKKKHGSF
jgi:hypothetical protein